MTPAMRRAGWELGSWPKGWERETPEFRSATSGTYFEMILRSGPGKLGGRVAFSRSLLLGGHFSFGIGG